MSTLAKGGSIDSVKGSCAWTLRRRLARVDGASAGAIGEGDRRAEAIARGEVARAARFAIRGRRPERRAKILERRIERQ